MEADKPSVAKKVIESTVKESHFSEVEELKKEVAELKAQILELSKVEEKEVVELKEEPKPIVHNPENKKVVEHVKLGKAKSNIDRILDTVYN